MSSNLYAKIHQVSSAFGQADIVDILESTIRELPLEEQGIFLTQVLKNLADWHRKFDMELKILLEFVANETDLL